MNLLSSLDEYFNFIGCDKSYKPTLIPCEICGSKSFTTICRNTDIGCDTLAPIPVQACDECGYLMQNPRFSPEFYERFYKEFYSMQRVKSRSNTCSDDIRNVGGKSKFTQDGRPNDHLYKNQLDRAKSLYEYIQSNNFKIPVKTMIDIGCGSGGFLEYFESKGYKCLGNDPEPKCAELGLSKGLKIDVIPAEDMELNEKLGLVIIMGSLEHVRDPNIILQKLWNSLCEEGIIIIQGRYFPVSESFRWLNANHHRFLTHEGAQSILIKHGFSILQSNTDAVCGGKKAGKSGSGYAFAIKRSSNERYSDINKKSELIDKLKSYNLVKDPKTIKDFVDKHDSSLKDKSTK